MKVSRRHAHSRRRSEFPRPDIRTPHFSYASRPTGRQRKPARRCRPGRSARRTVPSLVVHCRQGDAPRAPRPLPSPRLTPRLALPTGPVTGRDRAHTSRAGRIPAVGVCYAIPQRYCSRFSRLSLHPWKETKNEQARRSERSRRLAASAFPVHLLASAAAKAAMADRLGYAQAWLTLPISG